MKQKKSIVESVKSYFSNRKSKKIEELNEQEKLEKEAKEKLVKWEKDKESLVWWSNKKMIKFWVFWLLIALVWYFSFKVLHIIFLILSAYIVSMIMESFISWLQKHHFRRWLSIFFSYSVLLVVLFGIFIVVIPFLYNQLAEAWSMWLWYLSDMQAKVSENGIYSTIMNSEKIPDNLKEYFVKVSSDQWMVTKIQEAVQTNISEVINMWKKSVGQFWLFLVNFISWFTWFLVNFLLFFVLCILFSIEKDTMTTFLARIWWDEQFELNRLKIQKIYSKLAVWFRSRLFISLLLAIAMWIALVIMWWCGLVIPWKLWLALLAWLLDLIPYIWPILTWLLLFVVCILYNPLWVALIAVLILWIINVIENNVWAPLFMNKSLWISAVLIFISMLVWWLIMWFFWVLLSVPIAVILTIIFQNRHQLESDDLSQINKLESEEENDEVKKIKKQLKIVENLKTKWKNKKVND